MNKVALFRFGRDSLWFATRLKSHRIARIDAERLGRTNTRVGDVLARW